MSVATYVTVHGLGHEPEGSSLYTGWIEYTNDFDLALAPDELCFAEFIATYWRSRIRSPFGVSSVIYRPPKSVNSDRAADLATIISKKGISSRRGAESSQKSTHFREVSACKSRRSAMAD